MFYVAFNIVLAFSDVGDGSWWRILMTAYVEENCEMLVTDSSDWQSHQYIDYATNISVK